MRQEPVSTTLDLRPIPPPEPVPIPTSTWWIWLVPVVLIVFLFFWWSRKPVVRRLTPRDLLDEAIATGGQGAGENDFEVLDKRLREFLAWRQTPTWLSTPFAEAASLWKELLPGSELAADFHQRFASLEPCKYEGKRPDFKTIQQQKQAILELLAQLDEHDKLMKSGIFSPNETKQG